MELSKYEVFLKTVELGNITQAAEFLGYTQPAVSRVIADLEREWGVPLLIRGRVGVSLTPEGQAPASPHPLRMRRPAGAGKLCG